MDHKRVDHKRVDHKRVDHIIHGNTTTTSVRNARLVNQQVQAKRKSDKDTIQKAKLIFCCVGLEPPEDKDKEILKSESFFKKIYNKTVTKTDKNGRDEVKKEIKLWLDQGSFGTPVAKAKPTKKTPLKKQNQSNNETPGTDNSTYSYLERKTMWS